MPTMHNLRMILALLLMSHTCASAQEPLTGTIAGTIRYVGVVPPSQRITLTDGQVTLHNDIVVDAKTKGLRDVALTLDWKTRSALRE